MFIVGITGGIGSGKTAVSDRFQDKGITVVDADLCSRVVVEKGRPALAQIAERFGEDILDSNGELDRAQLRQKIFANADDKQWLESLLHPLIAEELLNQLSNAPSEYVILASPLLVESQQYIMCDEVIVVDVPEEVQLERTIQRDDNDAEQVKRIMASQATREKRKQHATIIIENTAGLDKLDTFVMQQHPEMLEKAQQKKAAQA